MPGLIYGGSRSGPASRKRRHGDVDDEEDGGSDADGSPGEGSSPIPPESNKRPRVSNTGPSNRRSSAATGGSSRSRVNEYVNMQGSESDSDSEEEEGEEEDGESGAPVPQTQYEEMRDGGFKHLQHEAQDDHRATQKILQRATQSRRAQEQLGENRVAENGIIESITCINFMCHEKLEVKLGPLLNFIVGENGSGKSAILTAITICLGGKASSTNRGGSLKAFIKEGQDQARLIVQIKNQGEDSYKHDLYGDSIIIERHFSRQGGTGFKVKSATNRVIETKKSEVEEIVEFYCLQVDNPLNVLSQDNARQFLNASSASMKYRFFIQGVQLEQLDKDYELVKELLDATEQKLPDQEEKLAIAQRNHDEAKKLLKAVENNHELRRQKRLFTNQLVWAQVVEQERKLQEREQAILAADANIAEALRAIEEAASVLQVKDEKLEAAQKALDEIKEEQGDAKANVDRAQEEFASAKTEVQKLHSDERDAHGRLTNASNRVKELEGRVNEERTRLEKANGDAVTETQARLDEARQRDANLVRQQDEATARVSELERNHAEARERREQKNMDVQRKKEEIKAAQNKIHSLKQRQSSPLEAYEQGVPNLLRAIAHDNGFAEKPVGPMGMHIKVLKPVWAAIVEKTLGGILNGFIVTSKRDHQRLHDLMKRHNVQRCPIFIANRQPLNTDGKEPDRQFDTILRILEFDDDIVRNQLIINSNIEQVILVGDRAKAEDVMFDPNGAPRNVRACLCHHDGKRGEGLRLTATGPGMLSTSPVIPGNQKPRMKTDADGQLSVQEDLLSQLQADLRELNTASTELGKAVTECLNAMNQNTKDIKSLSARRRSAQVQIRQIEEELDKFEGADDRLKHLEEELQLARGEKDQYGNQFGDMVVRKREQNGRMTELKKKLDEEKLQYRDFETRVDKLAEKVAHCQDVRRVELAQKNIYHEEAEKNKDDKRIAEERRDRQAAVVDEFTRQASTVSRERVFIPEDETHMGIEKKLEAVNKQLEQRHRRIGMTDEQVHLQVVETGSSLKTAVTFLEATKDHISRMKKSLRRRLAKWREFQRYISSMSRSNFHVLLSERGFRGRLLIDHKNKRLSVQVEPDETRKNATGRDTKTLSGGEKSFSSICLLLSIWEAMGSPLRCLDEFDVFMDNVNRAISTDMLISAARRSVGRQYILITPNAIHGAKALEKDVKIIRLTDPRQRTLDDMMG